MAHQDRIQIESIRVSNFKLFRNLRLDNLQPFSVFIGPNGVGKSTFFQIFRFLHRALQTNVTRAVLQEGGFEALLSRKTKAEGENSGALQQNIAFEIKFRNHNAAETPAPLVTYLLEITPNPPRIHVAREQLQYRRGQRGRPWRFLDFSAGEGQAVVNEAQYGENNAKEKRETYSLDAPDILALKSLGQLRAFPTIAAWRRLLDSWKVMDLKNSAMRTPADASEGDVLSSTGSNLAHTVKYLSEHHPKIFAQILEKIRRRIPGVEKVEARFTETGQVLLRFYNQAFTQPFIAQNVSDGTLKLLACLVLLHSPDSPPLLCIEEPEDYLHPHLMRILADELRDVAYQKGVQVFVTTHSPEFLDALELEELFFIERQQDGYSTISAAKDVEEAKSIWEAGAHLGWAWQRERFGERFSLHSLAGGDL